MPVLSKSKPFSAYNRGAMALHWLMALLIIVQLIGGYMMMHNADLEKGMRFMFFQFHKTFGILILLLAFLRVLWRLFSKLPSPLPLSKAEKVATQLVTFLFYALMLLVPLAGWALASLYPSRTPLMLFGNPNFVWPFLPLTPDAAAFARVSSAHAVLAYSFIALLALHICGALKHQFYDRIPIIARLVPTRKLAPVPAKKFVFLVLFLFITTASAAFMYYNNFTPPEAEFTPVITADDTADIAQPIKEIGAENIDDASGSQDHSK